MSKISKAAHRQCPKAVSVGAAVVCILVGLTGCAVDANEDFVLDDAAQAEEEVGAVEQPLKTGISLVVKSTSAGLIATDWQYREVATKKIWGCYDYDFLQNSGWFLATWYKTYVFVPTPAGQTVQLEQTVRAKLCNAKMDAFNYVGVKLETKAGPITGSFRVIPTGTKSSASAVCKDTNGTLVCSNAYVKVPTSGAITVTLSTLKP